MTDTTDFLHVEAFAQAVRDRRSAAGLSSRRAADHAGVSFMTLRRVEQGGTPDLTTFLRLCAWVRQSPSVFLQSGASRDISTIETIAQLLADDPRLDTASAERISSLVNDLYVVFAADPADMDIAVAHLVPPSALRPGVEIRLQELLADMHHQLLTQSA